MNSGTQTNPPLLQNYLGSDHTGELGALSVLVDKALESGSKSLFILSCDANGYDTQALDRKLKSLPVPVFGGIFPQLIDGLRRMERGAIVCGLNVEVCCEYVSNISDNQLDFVERLGEIQSVFPDSGSMIMLVDGLSQQIGALLDSIYEVLGGSYRYLGGGAGSLSFEQSPCLYSNAGLRQDCAQLTALKRPLSVSVEHGWQIFDGTYLVTSAEKNIVHTLNYRPAFDVYREVVEADCGKQFTEDNFFELAKGYPFGLENVDGVIVRDPLKRDGSSLVCVGEVPKNQLISILKGEPDLLLQASRQAAEQLAQADNLDTPTLFFDCISRVIFLDTQFEQELAGVNDALPAGQHLIGALTLGEIADDGDSCLQFYNKTAVLGGFSRV